MTDLERLIDLLEGIGLVESEEDFKPCTFYKEKVRDKPWIQLSITGKDGPSGSTVTFIFMEDGQSCEQFYQVP